MTILQHDHPLHNLLRSVVAKEAGNDRLDAGALALALWCVDPVGGFISAQVRIERDERDHVASMRSIQFCYTQLGRVGPIWTSRGFFDSHIDAFAKSAEPFDPARDSMVNVSARNIAVFMREAGMPALDKRLFVGLAKLGRIAREEAFDVVTRLRTDAGAPADFSEAPFYDDKFLSAVLDGVGTQEMRKATVSASKSHVQIPALAIKRDRADQLLEMLTCGCPADMVETDSYDKKQLIHIAAGSPKSLQVLLDHGACPVAAASVNQQTPLHHARNADVVRILLAAGARHDLQDSNGETPLHHLLRRAAYMDDVSGGCGLNELLAGGADPFYVPGSARADYLTPFQMLVKKGYVGQVQYVAELYAIDLGQRTVGGRTLAQVAGKDARMKALLKSIKAGLVVESSVEAANGVSEVAADGDSVRHEKSEGMVL